MDTKNILISCGILLVVVIIGGLAFMYSGVYNVAADREVGSFKRWVLSTTMERSVESRLDSVEVPDLDEEGLAESGAQHYDQMCVSCHGAPGVEQGEIAEGLNPPPPDFAKLEADEEPAELFWVTKHGIEMTGMPAWGTTHDDEAIWGMVALMKRFPEMSSDEYRELVESASGGGHHDGGGHGHGDGGHGH